MCWDRCRKTSAPSWGMSLVANVCGEKIAWVGEGNMASVPGMLHQD